MVMQTPPKKDNSAPAFDGQALIAWRERMGYSIRDAAEELGCSAGSIQNWESGETQVPKYIGIACDALALGMTARRGE